MNDQKPIESKITEWLAKEGHPLEMSVAASFRAARFRVAQSTYFHDADSGKPRELDVVSFRNWGSGNVGWQLTVVIECKVASAPWVLFTLPAPLEYESERFHYYRMAASALGRRLLAQVRRRTDTVGLQAFAIPERRGYGLRQALRGNADEPYEAAMKVSKASFQQATVYDSPEYASTPSANVVLPVIVLDGRLFEAYLSDANDLVVREVQSGVLDWAHPVSGAGTTWIRIVTKPALESFVADVATAADFLEHECGDEMGIIGKRWWDQHNRDSAFPES